MNNSGLINTVPNMTHAPQQLDHNGFPLGPQTQLAPPGAATVPMGTAYQQPMSMANNQVQFN